MELVLLLGFEYLNVSLNFQDNTDLSNRQRLVFLLDSSQLTGFYIAIEILIRIFIYSGVK